jgi:beta-aspartyl-peptidase (threonine type)
VSCTGHGEAIIRVVLAKSAVDLLKRGLDSQSAAEQAIELLAAKTESTGGLILIDRQGKIGYARNTAHMPVCMVTGSEQILLDS